MKTMYVYILTNPRKTVLYVGVTNDLYRRLHEHYNNRGKKATFAGRYHCYKLLYYELLPTPSAAISREKEIKGWRRSKKEALIKSENPNMAFIPWESVWWGRISQMEGLLSDTTEFFRYRSRWLGGVFLLDRTQVIPTIGGNSVIGARWFRDSLSCPFWCYFLSISGFESWVWLCYTPWVEHTSVICP